MERAQVLLETTLVPGTAGVVVVDVGVQLRLRDGLVVVDLEIAWGGHVREG